MSRLTTAKRRALSHGFVRRGRALRELRRLAHELSRSPLFDQELYEAQRGRHFRSSPRAAYDWIVEGSRRSLVAGPLLLPPLTAEGRRAGTGPAAWWAARLRKAGFPGTSLHPLFAPAWYLETYPEASTWPSGPLAHYTEAGRHAGARLGPRDPGGTDLVELGRAAVFAVARGDLVAVPSDSPEPEGSTDRQTSALLIDVDPGPAPLLALRAVLDVRAGVDRLVVVRRPASTPLAELAYAAAALLPDVCVIEVGETGTDALRDGLTHCLAGPVALITTPLDLLPDDIDRLVTGCTPSTSTTPVMLAADDTVAAAGLADRSGLAGAWSSWPWDDASRDGDRDVAGCTGELLTIDRDTARALLPVDGGSAREAVQALSLQASVEGRVRLVAAASAITPEVTSPPGAPAERPAYADASPAQRWAIKSPHPAGAQRATWGDFHFSTALAAALERRGVHVAVDPLDSWYRATAGRDDVTLTLRGLHRHTPDPAQVNLLWIISHPELVSQGELTGVDAVFAASTSWSHTHSREGAPVEPLLQCTDAERFRPDVAEPGTGYPLLFVGNSRSARRPIVEAALGSGHELAIIGGAWAGRVPPGVVRADHVDNATLPSVYRSAGVVLNDHWPAMAAEGFLSNRLFDLTAVGARWISDEARDLRETFPTARTASDAKALRALLDGAPGTMPSEDELREASEVVRRDHSFDARAATLVETVERLRARRR